MKRTTVIRRKQADAEDISFSASALSGPTACVSYRQIPLTLKQWRGTQRDSPARWHSYIMRPNLALYRALLRFFPSQLQHPPDGTGRQKSALLSLHGRAVPNILFVFTSRPNSRPNGVFVFHRIILLKVDRIWPVIHFHGDCLFT